MKEKEADIIAKMVRNLECPLPQKINYINSVCYELNKLDQFFNTKRFKTIAMQELDKGWPNHVELEWTANNR